MATPRTIIARIKKFIIFISLTLKGSLRATSIVSNTTSSPQLQDQEEQVVDKTFQTQWTQDLINEFPSEPIPIYSSNFGLRYYMDGDRIDPPNIRVTLPPQITSYQQADGTITIDPNNTLKVHIKPEEDGWLEETPITTLSTDNEELREEALTTTSLSSPRSFFEGQ